MQRRSSKSTSINAKRPPAIVNNPYARQIMSGKKVLDYGCGKYPEVTKSALKEVVSSYTAYDKYWYPDTDLDLEFFHVAIMSNVLNVIDDLDSRINAILDCMLMADDILITVYEGDKSGTGKESKKDCWQENRRLSSYSREVEEAIAAFAAYHGIEFGYRIRNGVIHIFFGRKLSVEEVLNLRENRIGG